MVEEYQLRLLPEEAYSEDTIRQYLSQEKGFDVAAIRAVRVVKRSIDARHRRVLVNLKGSGLHQRAPGRGAVCAHGLS